MRPTETARNADVIWALWSTGCGRRMPTATIRSIAVTRPARADPQADTDIMPTASLVEHEWQTHGTCSGLAANDYFAEIHKAYAAVKVPANIGTGSDVDGVTPDALLARFAAANPGYPAGSFALSCGNNRLTAVEICLTKDLQPGACQGVRSCRANVVKVTPAIDSSQGWGAGGVEWFEERARGFWAPSFSACRASFSACLRLWWRTMSGQNSMTSLPIIAWAVTVKPRRDVSPTVRSDAG